MKKFLLSIFAVLFAFAGAQAQDVVYTLEPANGSNNSYAGNCDITIDGITWNLTGNSQTNPWRIGGKSLTNEDRSLYSKTAMESAVSKVVLTTGTASSITVNSAKLLVAANADFSGAVEYPFSFKASSSIEIPVTAASGSYYKFVFNVTVSGTSNKYIQFSKAEFYGTTGEGGGEVDPTAEKPKFTPESCEFDLGGSVTVEISAAEGATIYYTTDGENPTEESDVYVNALTITETTTVKAIAVIEGHNNSAVAEATYTAVDPNAKTAEVVAKDLGYANAADVQEIKIGDYITVKFEKGTSSNATKYYSTGYGIRNYNGNLITFTAAAGVTINSIVFTAAGTSYTENPTNLSSGTATIDGTVTTISNIAASTLSFTQSSNTSRIQKIEVSYSVEEGVVVIATPSIAGEETFVGSTTVVITNNAEGTTLYYSTNGVDYVAYNDALNITETTTVSAYAQDAQGNKSSVAEATFTKLETLSIAEAKAAYDAAGAGVDVVVDLTGAVVTVNSGQYMFIQDSESGINVYNSSETYPVGTKFTSGLLVGSSAAYHGMHQIAAGAKFEGVETTEADITPIVVTVAQLKADYAAYEGRYVKLEGVALSGTTITQGDETYTLFDRFGITLEDADLCDIEGVPACYETTLQIFPTKIIPAATVELPEVSVASGTTIEQGAEITITPAIDNVVTYSVNGAAAVEIDGETTIVANEIGEMTLVVTSTYGGETLTETYAYTVVAPIAKVIAILSTTEIDEAVNASYSDKASVSSDCGVWTGYFAINTGNLQINNKNGYHVQSPEFPGRVISVAVTFASNTSTNGRGFVIMPSTYAETSATAANANCLGAASYIGVDNPTSTAILSGNDVTSFKVYSTGGAIYISNITVVYEKPSDFQLSVSEAGWATLYLGLDALIPAGVKCYTIAEDAVNAESVTLSQFEGTVLPAHTAVIVEANEDVYTFEYADNYSGLLSGNLLKGSITDTYVEGNAYVLGNKDGIGLYKAVLNKNEAGEAGTTHFKNNANKAYLPASVANGAASYSFRFGEGTTGVEKVEIRNEKSEIYDLTGRRVETITAPGIYVVNGKKVLVK